MLSNKEWEIIKNKLIKNKLLLKDENKYSHLSYRMIRETIVGFSYVDKIRNKSILKDIKGNIIFIAKAFSKEWNNNSSKYKYNNIKKKFIYN